MKKIDLGQGLTILANIGVLIGIAFLAIEIRQNTTSLEVGAYQDLLRQISTLNEISIQNPRVWNQIESVPLSEMEPSEWEATTSMIVMVFRHGDMAYHQYERGLISKERLESALKPLSGNIGVANIKELWKIRRNGFVESYRGYIDSLIEAC